jgi:UDP-glucuronate 4-epimerase
MVIVLPDHQNLLITGVAGFIGSHLAERLLARGDRVIGVDNFDPFYAPAEKRRNLARVLPNPAFQLIEADCADLAALEAALGTQRLDAVVHLAARAGVRPSIADPLGYAHANLTGTQAMLELARRRGVGRFVFASSSSVYGNNPKVPFAEDDPVEHPISPYAATKRAGELLCHTYHHLFGLSILSLRFFTVYGPRQRPDLAIRKFSDLILRGEPIPFYGDGSTERDYTWIDDILQGVLAAIDRTARIPNEFQIINLGESQTTTLSRLVELISAALGKEPRLKQLPLQPGDVQRTFADITRARELLDYHPTTLVEEGIPRFVEWILEELAERKVPAS